MKKYRIENNFDIISLFASLCNASLKITSLEIIEPNKKEYMRPQLNFMILAPSGSTKSTTLNDIGEAHNVRPYTSLTRAGIIGTIDKRTFQVIPGAVWDSRNNLFLIDEFKIGKNEDTIDPLLQFTESGHYKKKFGLFSGEQNEYDPPNAKNDLYFKVKNGELEIKTRISVILATLKWLEYDKNPDTQALISRFIPFRWFPTRQELEKVAIGEKTYKNTRFKPKQHTKIKLKDYMKIKSFVDQSGVGNEIYLRCIGDLCRIFTITKNHDEPLYGIVCKLKQAALEKYLQGKEERKPKKRKGETDDTKSF